MPYKPAPWFACGDNWTIRWSPTAPHLRGTEPALSELRERLLDENMLTPTGPFVRGDESDPVAVLAALPMDRELFGSPPPIPEIPEGALG